MPYADHDGVRISYEVLGNGSGPPVLLHHGFTADRREWHEFGYVDALGADYRLLLLDARGHGKSDKPHEPAAYAMDRRARDVLAVLDAAGVEQVHYLGFSMGGRIGFDTARRAPERLRSLMIGAAHPYAAPTSPASTQPLREGMAAWLARLRLPSAVATPAFMERELANDVEALIAATVDRPGLEDVLPRLTMPVLAWVGQQDGTCVRVRQWVTQVPHATLVELPDLDHVASLYRSDLVLPHLRTFLAHAAHPASA
jgi:pimeloyl-ACP methyl ester carboxylesterase